MNRRKFLRRTSALGVLGLAGCTGAGNDEPSGTDGGSGGAGGESSPTATPTETQTPPPTVTDYDIRTVDSRCKSEDERASVHKSESAVTIMGMITASNPCYEAVLNAVDYTIASDTLRVDVGVERTDDPCADCVGAVEYEATVNFADGPPGSVTVSHGGERIEAGDIESGKPAEVDAPMLVESSLSVTNVSNSVGETTADATFDTENDVVTATGTIEGSDGCKTAELASADYDPSEDSLTVDVETVDREDAGTCTQALVYIDYEATFEFEGGVPKSVAVQHDGRGVMSAAHSSASASAPDDQS
jgi:hypothetical protein